MFKEAALENAAQKYTTVVSNDLVINHEELASSQLFTN